MRYCLTIVALLVCVGCAGPQLQRLDGEPKSSWPLTTATVQGEQPVVAGLKRFITAAQGGRSDRVYWLLSALTKRALKQRAKAIGVQPAELLRAPSKSAGPGAMKVHISDPLATFALRNATEFIPGPPPMSPNKRNDGRTIMQVVTLKGGDGGKRDVKMRFEGLYWRVHNPSLSVATGPAATK